MSLKGNTVLEKSFQFSLKCIKIHKNLKDQNQFDLARQFLRAGTSIGANIEESNAAFSKKDFVYKMAIASKEARETRYWLRLFKESELIKVEVGEELEDVQELIRMLTSIVKTTQKKLHSPEELST